jgi:hypothetical protein
MTDKERQKLVLRLYQARMASHRFSALHDLCEEAADEIERLAAENKKLRDDVEWAQHVEGVRRRRHYT